ncbi:MAG: hypothetical protein QE284_06515 [Rhizobium sp.]|nr:hypothetical protein [Rhizobium sp.]
MRTPDQEITVSQSIPTPLRVLLACIALGLLMVLWVELAGGLWPVSPLTPIFAIIVVGGSGVLLSFMAFAVAGPDERWTVRPGILEVEQRLFDRRHRFRVSPDDGDCQVVKSDTADAGESWHIVIQLKAPIPAPEDPLFRLLLSLSGRKSRSQLSSPSFSREERARHALDVLLGEGGEPGSA